MSDLGPEARSVLLAGKDGDEPTSQDRARVRKKLARAIAAGTALGAASAVTAAEGTAAAAAKTGALLTLAKIGGGLVFVAALGAGIWSTRPRHPEAPPLNGAPAITAPVQTGTLAAAPPADSPAPSVNAGSPAAAANAESPAPPANAGAAAPSGDADSKAASAAAPSTAARSTAAGDPPDTLEEETRRLREAHSAMQSGDPQKALTLLDQQSSRFGDGQLADERVVARILALCKLGRDAEAQAKAAELLRTSPSSPLLGRVRGGCPRPSSN